MSKSQSANEGIQATNVTADVLAVGRGAKAVKTVYGSGDTEKLLEAIRTLSSEVDKLSIPKPQQEEIKAHAQALEQAVSSKSATPEEKQGAFTKLVGGLKNVGLVLTEAAGFAAPIRTIAGLLHLSLAALGI